MREGSRGPWAPEHLPQVEDGRTQVPSARALDLLPITEQLPNSRPTHPLALPHHSPLCPLPPTPCCSKAQAKVVNEQGSSSFFIIHEFSRVPRPGPPVLQGLSFLSLQTLCAPSAPVSQSLPLSPTNTHPCFCSQLLLGFPLAWPTGHSGWENINTRTQLISTPPSQIQAPSVPPWDFCHSFI